MTRETGESHNKIIFVKVKISGFIREKVFRFQTKTGPLATAASPWRPRYEPLSWRASSVTELLIEDPRRLRVYQLEVDHLIGDD